MKFIDNILFIEWSEMLSIGISDNTLKSAKLRQSSSWKFLNDPTDARRVLIEFESLGDKYKDLIIRKYGNPYVASEAKILDKFMSGKPEDLDFLNTFRLPDSRFLPKDTLPKYITAVKVLHFCSLMADKKKIGSIGVPNMKTFWQMVISYIIRNNASLPENVKRLQAKIAEYAEVGPQCVISGKFLNKCALKITEGVCEAVLLEMIAHHNQFDDAFIAAKYNAWAALNCYKTISQATVYNHRHKNKLTVAIGRYGLKEYGNQFDRTIHREQAPYPLALINSDDNDLDLYFLDDRGAKKNHYWRPKVMIVMDAYKNYPLGWAIGDQVTSELVREAYLNAVHHVHELTGSYYLWHQIQADRYAKASLEPWYQRQAVYIPSRTGLARVKRIESFFGHTWHKYLKLYNNYTGHNITAKSKPNVDALKAIAKDAPHRSQAYAQVSHFINQLRTREMEGTGLTCLQEWSKGWAALEEANKRQLTTENRLMLFGKCHSHKNTITKEGLRITVGGERLTFDIPEQEYRKHVQKTMNVAYDPYDMSKVLAYSDDESVQIVCPVYEKMRDVVVAMKEGDRARLNSLLERKQADVHFASTEPLKRKEILKAAGVELDNVLAFSDMTKGALHSANQLYVEMQTNQEKSTKDFNSIFDKDYED